MSAQLELALSALKLPGQRPRLLGAHSTSLPYSQYSCVRHTNESEQGSWICFMCESCKHKSVHLIEDTKSEAICEPITATNWMWA